jgi:hypothetical protein
LKIKTTTTAAAATSTNHQASILSELEDFVEDVDDLVGLAGVDLRQELVQPDERSGPTDTSRAMHKNVG